MGDKKPATSDLEKIQERLNKLEEENKKLKKEVESLKGESGQIQNNNNDEKLSRREFLKKAGLGTAGLAALSLSPASALDVKTEDFKINTGPNGDNLEQYFSVASEGPIQINNTDLILNDNDIDNINILGSGQGQYIHLQAGSRDEISLNYGAGEAIRFYNYDSGNVTLKTRGDDINIPNGSLSISKQLELKTADLNHRPANNTEFRSIFAPNNNDKDENFTFEEIFYTTKDGESIPGIRTIYTDRPGDTTYPTSVRETSLEKRIIVGQQSTVSMTEQTGWFLTSGPTKEYSARFGVSTDNPENPFEVYDTQIGAKTFRVQDNGPISVEKVDIRLDTGQVVRWGNNGARIAYENGGLVAYDDSGNSTILI